MIKFEQDSNASTKEPQASDGVSDIPSSTPSFAVELSSSNESEGANEHDSQTAEPTPKPEPEASDESTATETTSSESSELAESPARVEKPEARKKFHSTDPIHWYGILVPQSLRKSQTSFTAVIDNQVPDLASTTLEMRALEERIRKLQVQLESEP